MLIVVYRVPVKIIGGEGKPAQGQVEIKELPKHKKNDQVGTKKTYYSESIFVEQADAASFAQDEEVSPFPTNRFLPSSLCKNGNSRPFVS